MNTSATQINLDAFFERLALEYENLFQNDPEYAYAASKTNPRDLARKMTLGLDNGQSNKDGEGIKRACKHFGIAHTYKAIRTFLQAA
jgi:hypothetical protein